MGVEEVIEAAEGGGVGAKQGSGSGGSGSGRGQQALEGWHLWPQTGGGDQK